jgi:ArsR family transcriptional regulator, arsenate/arsenite/antimonite-responsive transcriptional repressor
MEKSAVIDSLSALAQDTRLDIFRSLVQAGHEGVSAGSIATKHGLPSATLSFHLNQLRRAGLIRYRREGRSLIYAAEYGAMNDLVAYLTENCCQSSGDCGIEACDAAGIANENRASGYEAPTRPHSR